MLEQDKRKETIQFSKRIISFIGPEGSGKTTQAHKLCNDSGKPYLTTGDTLRYYRDNDRGRLGDACRKMFSENTYLAGELLLEIMSERFGSDDTKDGFVLDGGFRTVEETLGFPATIENAGRNFPVTVIYLNIPREVCYERLVRGKNARKRYDDTEEALTSRLDKFYDHLEERLDLIKSNPNWNFVEIDGTASVKEIYENILRSVVK
jgi:adenylate kinase